MVTVPAQVPVFVTVPVLFSGSPHSLATICVAPPRNHLDYIHHTITSHISHMATRLKFWWFDIVDTIGDDYHRWYITTDKDIYEYMSVHV